MLSLQKERILLEYRIFRVQRTEYRVQQPCGVVSVSTYYMYHEEYSVSV